MATLALGAFDLQRRLLDTARWIVRHDEHDGEDGENGQLPDQANAWHGGPPRCAKRHTPSCDPSYALAELTAALLSDRRELNKL